MSKALQIGVLISGRGSNLQAIQSEIESEGLPVQIALVTGDKPLAPGLVFAKEKGLPVFHCDVTEFKSKVEFEQAIVTQLQAHGVEWVVLAGYMRLVGPTLLGAFPKKIINIHPSLLPAFKGLNAQKQAFEYGVRVAGCTTHLVTEDLDGGPILLQQAIPVLPQDTSDTLSARILKEEHRLLPKTLRLLAEGKIKVNQTHISIEE